MALSDLTNVGGRYRSEQGTLAELVELAPHRFMATSGRVFVGDLATPDLWQSVPFDLPAGELPVRVFALEFDSQWVVEHRVTAVAIGDESAVRTWVAGDDGGEDDRLGFGAEGTGIFGDEAHRTDLSLEFSERDRAMQVIQEIFQQSAVPLGEGAVSSGLCFDCGMGDGWYPIHRGVGDDGRTVLLLLDLELVHHLTLDA